MFKHKPEKLKYLDNIKTVDELHKEKIELFDRQQNELKNQQSILKKYTMEYEKEHITNNQKKVLQKKINDVTKKINSLDIHELDYYYMTFDIITEYYNNEDKVIETIQIETENDNPIPNTNDISNNLYKLHEISKKRRKRKQPIKKRRITYNGNGRSILEYLSGNVEKIVSNKATLQDEYLNLLDKNYSCNKTKKSVVKICDNCKIEKILIPSDAAYVCNKCGELEYVIIESEIPSHKDILTEKPRYPYKKMNHLMEKLNQFQSKESIKIPDELYKKFDSEIKKRKYKSEEISLEFIKKILKKYKYTHYYEHIQYIHVKITKIKPPILTHEQEETIKKMFKQVEDLFNKHRPADRSNFLNYSFVIHKLFLIMGLKEHAKFFNLLKSKEKLKYQEKIWKKICEDLEWPYIANC